MNKKFYFSLSLISLTLSSSQGKTTDTKYKIEEEQNISTPSSLHLSQTQLQDIKEEKEEPPYKRQREEEEVSPFLYFLNSFEDVALPLSQSYNEFTNDFKGEPSLVTSSSLPDLKNQEMTPAPLSLGKKDIASTIKELQMSYQSGESNLCSLPHPVVAKILEYVGTLIPRAFNKLLYFYFSGTLPLEATRGPKALSPPQHNLRTEINLLGERTCIFYNKTFPDIPSWLWKYYISQVGKIPLEFLSHLKGTNIQKLNMMFNNIAKDAPEFAYNLQGTNIQKLNMRWNAITGHAPDFARNLQGTNVQELSMNQNEIKEHAPDFARNLQGTKVQTLHIIGNQIRKHALQFAQELKNTNVRYVDLRNNYIDPQTQEAILNLNLPITFIF